MLRNSFLNTRWMLPPLHAKLIEAMANNNALSVSQILNDNPALVTEQLRPQPWAVIQPEQLLPIEYIIKYTEIPLGICFKFYPHDDCHRFIDSNIKDVRDLVRILDRLPEQERLSVAQRNQAKMTMWLHQVLSSLPPESRLEYTRQNPQAFEAGTAFVLVLEQLPTEDRQTCVNENRHKIQGEFGRSHVERLFARQFQPMPSHFGHESTLNNKK